MNVVSIGDFDCTLGGSAAERLSPVDLERQLPRLIDPASASKTLHWGRNYLYVTSLEIAGEDVPVVVKQFRNQTRKAQLRRRMRGSKAERSFRAAQTVLEIGLETPEPLVLIDSKQIDGPSFYVCRYLEPSLEVRYVLRALNDGTERELFPAIETDALLRRMGALARTLHRNEIWHRDLTSGNILLYPQPQKAGDEYRLYLLDLNRARIGKPVRASRRARELGRMPVLLEHHQEVYLEGYHAPDSVSDEARRRYRFHHRAFLLKNQSKKNVRGFGRRLGDVVLPRRKAHVHIPDAEKGASSRDKIVWDVLSDQPHQHATKMEKLRVRLSDAPAHAATLWTAGRALKRARTRADQLRAGLYAEPVELPSPGICLRPWPRAPEALLEAVDDLAVDKVLVRLHPWEEQHQAELELVRALSERGLDLAFALPQTRELVRDKERWRSSVSRLGEVFSPYGRHFQVGQAINRSKWGVWKTSDYVDLFVLAAQELRSLPGGVELLGPSVIDFEPHATAGALNVKRQGYELDATSHLLYVDRRGAPENEQMGLDTVGKVVLLKALAETSVACPSGRCWITEVNWPLWEGPHSPAGKDVAVSEDKQADYLSRYFLHVLASGLVERVYWWQLVAKGYGLIDPDLDRPEKLRRRPSYEAFKRFVELFAGATSLGALGGGSADEFGYRLRLENGDERRVSWKRDGTLTL